MCLGAGAQSFYMPGHSRAPRERFPRHYGRERGVPKGPPADILWPLDNAA